MNLIPGSCLLQNKFSAVICDALILLSLSVLFTKGTAQTANYVTNPGFENVILTSTLSPWDGLEGWSAIDISKRAFIHFSVGQPKYNLPYSSLGFQFPRTGKNMIVSSFFYSNGNPESNRWYPRNKIKQPLKPNATYCARYFVVNTNNSSVGIDAFSILLAGTEIDTVKKCNIPLAFLSPQIVHLGGIVTDTMNWTAVSGTLTAVGHENYLVLGNFRSDATTQTIVINPTYLPKLVNDCYIDDVSLVEMELPAYAGRDTSIWAGDSIFLGREPDVGIDYACQWYRLPNDTVPIDTIAGLWVKPTSNTTYVVRQQLWCSGVKWDTVRVHMLAVGLEEDIARQFEIYPNPVEEEIRIRSRDAGVSFSVVVSDVAGKVLCERHETSATGELRLNMAWPDGLYFVQIKTPQGPLTRKVVVQR